MNNEIPEVVILRLPLYARVLELLASKDVQVASSQILGSMLQATPAQIRKDLSYFGRFGKQGRGYSVSYLLGEIRLILGLDHTWYMAVVGVGQLGTAIVNYGGFADQGFIIVAAFDSDSKKQGQTVGGLVVQSMAEIKETVRRLNVDIGIVAVPASQGQMVTELLVESGVKGILNYAPFQARAVEGVWVRDIDPVVSLQSMTYHLKAAKWGMERHSAPLADLETVAN